MSFHNKNKAGYIGYFRYSTPEIASGVWNLKTQYNEASNSEWYSQTLFSSKEGITGWTTNGSSILTNNSIGYPSAPSIEISTAGDYGYISTGLPSLVYTTIVFEAYMPDNEALEFYFAHSNTGQGNTLKLDTRAGYYSGLMYHTTWTVYGGEPIQGIELTPNVWNKVAIRIPSSADTSWYINGSYRDREVVLLNGVNIGVRKFAGNGTCYVDNIRVYRGPV